jgi:LPXTG-motif cell wall-anchored protein
MKLAGIFALIFALALPSAALAQGAGDEQYSDPFAGEQQEEEQQQPAPEATPEPVAPEAAPAAPEAAPAPAAPAPAAAPSSSEQLPYTGADAGLLALGGALLVAAGVALRVRDRRRA